MNALQSLFDAARPQPRPSPLLEVLDLEWLPPDVMEEVASGEDCCALYTRYSTPGQKATSIKRQREGCLPYATKIGKTVYRCYADQERTGTALEDREELELMLQHARQGKFRHIIVEDVDRLARWFLVAVDIWKELKELGVSLHTPEDGELTTVAFANRAAAAEADWSKFVTRTQNGKRDSVRAGNPGVKPGFGYRKVRDANDVQHIEVYEPEAEIVQFIFAQFVMGVSPQKICDHLNDRPIEKRGKDWWEPSLLVGSIKMGSGILRRCRYIGVNVFGRTQSKTRNGKLISRKLAPQNTWVVSKLPAHLHIVDRSRFRLAQQMLKHRSEAFFAGKPVGRYTAKHFALRGILKCKSCGSGLTPTQKRKDTRPRLLCNNARNQKKKETPCQNTRSIAAEHVESAVRQLLVENLAQPEALAQLVEEQRRLAEVEESKADRERVQLERQFEDVDHQLKAFEASYDEKVASGFPKEFLAEQIAPLSDRWKNLKNELQHPMQPVRKADEMKLEIDAMGELVGTLDELFSGDFDTTTPEASALIGCLRKLVDNIVVDIQDEFVDLEISLVMPGLDVEGNRGLQIHTLHRRIKRPGQKWNDYEKEVRRVDKLVDSGAYALTDAEWAQVAPFVPASIGCSTRGTVAVDSRAVIRAALLHINEGVPQTQMPAAIGPSKEMAAALKRLSYHGSWDAVFAVLSKIRPEWVDISKSTAMFGCERGKYSSALVGRPLERARHGVAVAEGRHAPTDEEWALVQDLIPEQYLHVDKREALISPRQFLHAVFYLTKEHVPLGKMPTCFGPECYLLHCLKRFVYGHGWDKLVARLQANSPQTLQGLDTDRFNVWTRASSDRPVLRRVRSNLADRVGVPAHAPTEAEWNIIHDYFPAELLYVGDKLAVQTPRLLAHALFYRIRAKVPFAAFPNYFGDPDDVKLTVVKFVFHRLWDAMVRDLADRSPKTLEDADMHVFDRYRRSKMSRYGYLLDGAVVPEHAPDNELWAVMEDLVPVRLLQRGGVGREPRHFLHAVMWLLATGLSERAMPGYFGDRHEFRLALRRFIRHRFYDEFVCRFKHFYPDRCIDWNFARWDHFARSASAEPDFRARRLGA